MKKSLFEGPNIKDIKGLLNKLRTLRWQAECENHTLKILHEEWQREKVLHREMQVIANKTSNAYILKFVSQKKKKDKKKKSTIN